MNIQKSLKIAIFFLLIVQLAFQGCNPVPSTTNTPATATLTAIPTRVRTATPTAIAITPTPRPQVLATLPDNCFFDGLSPNNEWIVMTCGVIDPILQVMKVGGDIPPVTLYKEVGSVLDFSSDGKKMVLAIDSWDDEKSTWDIWLYNLGEWQTPQLLLSQSTVWGLGVHWSPDNQSIAVSYLEDGYALSILYFDGTVKNLLTYDDVDWKPGYDRFEYGPAWSPDGKKIAYVNADLWETQFELHTVEIATGKKELLYSSKPGETGFSPMWSPNGKKIALGSFMEKSHPIYFYDIGENKLTAIGDFYFGYGATWSPDSERLLVCNQLGELYSISVNSKQVNKFKERCTFLVGWDGDNVLVLKGSNLYSIPPQ